MTDSKVNLIKQYMNNETELTWQKIDELIQELDSEKDITSYEPLIIQSILSDRSKLSGTALLFLKNAAIKKYKTSKSNNDLSNISFINYINPLFKLVGRSKKVFSLRGEETLNEVIKNIARPLVFLKENCSSLNKNVRLVSYKLLYDYYTRTCDTECLPLFENGLKDANLEVRMVCKKISKGNESFIASIPRRAKEVFASLKSYSPFKKHVKLNDETKVKTNPEEMKVKEEIKIEKIEDIVEKQVKRTEPIEKLKILSETPKKKDLAVTLTPRKLQEYIDKYNNDCEIERKYLIKFEEEEETVKLIKGLCNDIKIESKYEQDNETGIIDKRNIIESKDEQENDNKIDIIDKRNMIESKYEQDNETGIIDKENMIETNAVNKSTIINDNKVKEQESKNDEKKKQDTCDSTSEKTEDRNVDEINNIIDDIQLSKDNSIVIKDEIDDIFMVVKNCENKETSDCAKNANSESYTTSKLTEIENYLKTSNEKEQNTLCNVAENSLLQNIEYHEETKNKDISEADRSNTKVKYDVMNLKEKRISASFSKLSINDESVVTIEESLKNMSVTENKDEETKKSLNASEFTTVQSDVYVHKNDVVNKQDQ